MRVTVVAAAIAALCLVTGCHHEDESRTVSTTMTSDYALFEVNNDQAQANALTLTVDGAQPGDQFVLFFSDDVPKNEGWFQIPLNGAAVCPDRLDDHCQQQGEGYLVDVVTASRAGSIQLFDTRASEDVYDVSVLGSLDDHREWTGYWAVMRVSRTGVATPITFHVEPRSDEDDSDYVVRPDVKQLR